MFQDHRCGTTSLEIKCDHATIASTISQLLKCLIIEDPLPIHVLVNQSSSCRSDHNGEADYQR